MQGSAEDAATGGGVAPLTSLCLLGAAATLVAGLLVPRWGLMMMALSVALSGMAFATKAIRDGADPPPPPAPVPLSLPSPRPTAWDVDPRNALESAAITLPPNLFDESDRGSVTAAGPERKAAADRPVEQPPPEKRTALEDERADAGAGLPDPPSSPGGLVPVAWGSGVQPVHETSPDEGHTDSAMLARVVAEGELIRAEVRELHERLRAGLADEIEQLHERSTLVLNEVRQLSEQHRQVREGLAGAVRQTATWLVRSRNELYERLDSVSRAVETARLARDDALAVASAEREATERLSARLGEQAEVAVETLEQHKQLHEKLEAVTRLTEEARSSWRGELEELQEKVVQAVVDQRVGYATAAEEASARDRAELQPLVHLVQEQSALIVETLQEQKQLHSEVATLREQVARRTTPKAPRPTAGEDDERGTVADSVPLKARSTARRSSGERAEAPHDGGDEPPAKRSAAKKATGTTRAPATKAAVAKTAKKVPPAKAATKAVSAKVATKAPSAKAATATKKSAVAKAAASVRSSKVAPAKSSTKAPSAKAAHKATPARSATKAATATAATKTPAAKAGPRTAPGRMKRGAATVTR